MDYWAILGHTQFKCRDMEVNYGLIALAQSIRPYNVLSF